LLKGVQVVRSQSQDRGELGSYHLRAAIGTLPALSAVCATNPWQEKVSSQMARTSFARTVQRINSWAQPRATI